MAILLIIFASFFVIGCGISIATLVVMNVVDAYIEMRKKIGGIK